MNKISTNNFTHDIGFNFSTPSSTKKNKDYPLSNDRDCTSTLARLPYFNEVNGCNSTGVKERISPKGLFTLLRKKSYVPISGCVLEHIASTDELSCQEKLFFLLANSLAIINSKTKGKRAVALPAASWAQKLGCSRASIFTLQRSLAHKGYFLIAKSKNSYDQNQRNLITPTLPDSIAATLRAEPDRIKNMIKVDYHYTTSTHSTQSNVDLFSKAGITQIQRAVAATQKLLHLDQTKLFIPLNYQLLELICKDTDLSPLQKIIWLDLYLRSFKVSPHHKYVQSNKTSSYIDSYKNLALRYSCSLSSLSRAITNLEKQGFISKTRLLLKHSPDLESRRDKVLWQFLLSLPIDRISLLKHLDDRSSITSHSVEEVQELSDTSLDTDGHTCVESDHTFAPINHDDSTFIQYKNRLFKIHKNRSTKSNFFKKVSDNWSSCSNNQEQKKQEEKGNKKKTRQKLEVYRQGRILADFAPLSQEDCEKLQILSRRDFNLRSMNEILKSMATKLKDRIFYSKKAFLNYMAKALAYELRDAVKINNDTFVIKSNQSTQEIEYALQEQYLAEIENNLHTGPESHFKRKLAATLEPNKAYRLLKAWRFLKEQKNGLYILELSKHLELTNNDRRIILNQFKATHDRYDLGNPTYLSEELKINMPEKKDFTVATNTKRNTNTNKDEHSYTIHGKQYTPVLRGLWGEIRKKLIGYYRHEGAALDKSWFSKLEASIDKQSMTLSLKAPTAFIKDYIIREYGDIIQRFAKEINYTSSIFKE